MQKVMLGRHNPGLTVLANAIGDGAISDIPTSGAYCIALAMASRSKICKLHGRISTLSVPKSVFAEL
jgi:hypothetical protein